MARAEAMRARNDAGNVPRKSQPRRDRTSTHRMRTTPPPPSAAARRSACSGGVQATQSDGARNRCRQGARLAGSAAAAGRQQRDRLPLDLICKHGDCPGERTHVDIRTSRPMPRPGMQDERTVERVSARAAVRNARCPRGAMHHRLRTDCSGAIGKCAGVHRPDRGGRAKKSAVSRTALKSTKGGGFGGNVGLASNVGPLCPSPKRDASPVCCYAIKDRAYGRRVSWTKESSAAAAANARPEDDSQRTISTGILA